MNSVAGVSSLSSWGVAGGRATFEATGLCLTGLCLNGVCFELDILVCSLITAFPNHPQALAVRFESLATG